MWRRLLRDLKWWGDGIKEVITACLEGLERGTRDLKIEENGTRDPKWKQCSEEMVATARVCLMPEVRDGAQVEALVGLEERSLSGSRLHQGWRTLLMRFLESSCFPIFSFVPALISSYEKLRLSDGDGEFLSCLMGIPKCRTFHLNQDPPVLVLPATGRDLAHLLLMWTSILKYCISDCCRFRVINGEVSIDCIILKGFLYLRFQMRPYDTRCLACLPLYSFNHKQGQSIRGAPVQ